jgi:hypothetical protein
MSVLTPKRLFLCVVAVLLADSAFARHPSPRAYAGLAYDSKHEVSVLFGGRGKLDQATGGFHASNETWLFGGSTWAQQFPATVPPARSVHSMVSDEDGRVYMFGGRQEGIDADAPPTFLSDLWKWENGNWTRVDEGSATRPSARQYAGLAYDRDRDVLVLYGGQIYGGEEGAEIVPEFDTWEFSPATGQWTAYPAAGAPPVAKPQLAYDGINKKVVMLGVTNDLNTTPLMYVYDPVTRIWTKANPPALPPCTNEGHLFQQNGSFGRMIYFGGFCRTGTSTAEEVYEFDGETWLKLPSTAASRGIGQATTWDTHDDRAIVYGGSLLLGQEVTAFTNILEDLQWRSVQESRRRPVGRSLMTFDLAPSRDHLRLYGGLSEFTGSFLSDEWLFRNGRWEAGPETAGAPIGGCDNPLSALDTDRNKLVMLCTGSEVWEFDGTVWKAFTALDPRPNERRFANMVYDKKLKKTVLFGGFLGSSYRNDTWTWDGAKWTELDIDNDDRPPHRGTMAMWYDPLAQKTILYGGIGRGSINEKVKRFADMWSFDGTRWVNMNITATPGIRFRPLQAVGPDGKVTIFGGLRVEQIDEDSIRQYFGDDLWQWDGSTSKWTQLEQPALRPLPRQNGALGFDPATGNLVLFGGYGDGFYYSDTWTWNGSVWTPIVDEIIARRRSAR